ALIPVIKASTAVLRTTPGGFAPLGLADLLPAPKLAALVGAVAGSAVGAVLPPVPLSAAASTAGGLAALANAKRVGLFILAVGRGAAAALLAPAATMRTVASAIRAVGVAALAASRQVAVFIAATAKAGVSGLIGGMAKLGMVFRVVAGAAKAAFAAILIGLRAVLAAA